MFGKSKLIKKIDKVLENNEKLEEKITNLIESIEINSLKVGGVKTLLKDSSKKIDLLVTARNNNSDVVDNLNALVKLRDSQLFEAEEQQQILADKLEESEQKRRVQNGEKGNLTRKFNEALTKTEELEAQLKKTNDEIAALKEKLKNSYTRSVLPPDEPINKQKTKLKNHVKNSQVKAILKSKNEEEVTQNV